MTPARTMIEMVRRMAAKYPSARYCSQNNELGCMYDSGTVVEGPERPGCIMREVVEKFFPESLHKRISIVSLICDSTLASTAAERRWLADVQTKQDRGVTWGDAVKRADDCCVIPVDINI